MGRTIELEPDEVDVVRDAVQAFMERQEAGQDRALRGEPVGMTAQQATNVVQACIRILEKLLRDELPEL
jgi:hypothetical protein